MRYLHIGNGKSIKKEDVVGIFDLDSATVSAHTKRSLQHYTKEGCLFYTDNDLPRSFVLVCEGKKKRIGKKSILLSRISASLLCERGKEGDIN